VSRPRYIVGYVGCYLRHFAILGSCISVFDVESNVVFFWFVDECKVKWFVLLCVFEFIDCLVGLIVDKNFELIWCYGLCSRRTVGRL
jgi:hypothetical protein